MSLASYYCSTPLSKETPLYARAFVKAKKLKLDLLFENGKDNFGAQQDKDKNYTEFDRARRQKVDRRPGRVYDVDACERAERGIYIQDRIPHNAYIILQ